MVVIVVRCGVQPATDKNRAQALLGMQWSPKPPGITVPIRVRLPGALREIVLLHAGVV